MYSLLQGVATGVISFLPFFLLDIGGSPIDVGTLSFLPGLASTLMQLAWGRVSDRVQNSRRLVIQGYLVTAILSFPILFVVTPWHLFATYAFLNIFSSITQVANTVLISDYVDSRQRAALMGWYYPANCAGNMVGSSAAGLLIQFLGYRITLFTYVLFNLAIALSIKYGLPEPKNGHQLDIFGLMKLALKELPAGFRRVPELKKRGGNYTHWVIGIAIRGFGIAMFGPVFTVYVAKTLKTPTPEIGVLQSLSSAIGFVTSPILGYIAEKRGAKNVMLMGVMLAALYPLSVIVFPGSGGLVITYTINGLFWACINTSWIPWMLDLIPGQTGVYLGLLNFVNGLEWAVGTEIGGFIGEYNNIWVAVASSTSLILWAFFLLSKVPEKEKDLQ